MAKGKEETKNEKRLRKEKELDKLSSWGLENIKKTPFRKKDDYGTSLSKGAEYAGKEASKKARKESSPLVFEKNKMRLKTEGETVEEMLKARRKAEKEAASEERREARGMMGGGMVKKYAAGGMAKCGASNPPSGKTAKK
jgi:hypothetical protein